MKYTTTFRTFAFPEALIEQLPTLNEQYGEEATDGLLTVTTIACGWDDSEHTRLRALRFPETASLTDLADGRKAYTALWSLRLLEAIGQGLFPDVQELTQEELIALLPQIVEPPLPDMSEPEVIIEEPDHMV
jgi:hypothetical protein